MAKRLFKCSVCNFIWEGDNSPDVCPKCGQKHDVFKELPLETVEKIYKSEKTNDLHAEIISLTSKMIALSKKGIELDLDPACVKGFKQTIEGAYVIKQRAKAEIENHIAKEKW
jgi:rubredoxin